MKQFDNCTIHTYGGSTIILSPGVNVTELAKEKYDDLMDRCVQYDLLNYNPRHVPAIRCGWEFGRQLIPLHGYKVVWLFWEQKAFGHEKWER